MKSFPAFLSLLAGLTLITGCGADKASDPAPAGLAAPAPVGPPVAPAPAQLDTVAARLVGGWLLTGFITQTYSPSGALVRADTVHYPPALCWLEGVQFNADGTYVGLSDCVGCSQGRYYCNGYRLKMVSLITSGESSTTTIVRLTASELALQGDTVWPTTGERSMCRTLYGRM